MLNPHMWLSRVGQPPTNNWKCNYCGLIGSAEWLNSIACSYNYPPCEYCGQTPECAIDCLGVWDILANFKSSNENNPEWAEEYCAKWAEGYLVVLDPEIAVVMILEDEIWREYHMPRNKFDELDLHEGDTFFILKAKLADDIKIRAPERFPPSVDRRS